MTTIYEVTFKKNGEKFYYTSLIAIGFAHAKDEIDLSPGYVQKIKFQDGLYENNKIFIKRLKARGKSDILDKQQKSE